MSITSIKKDLIKEARIKSGKIYPIQGHKKIKDCFSQWDDKLVFWYNCKCPNRKQFTSNILYRVIHN